MPGVYGNHVRAAPVRLTSHLGMLARDGKNMKWTHMEYRPGADGRALHLQLAPDPRLGRGIREQVLAYAASRGIAPADLGDFVTAIGEALANAMEHSQTTEPIEVTVWRHDGTRIMATIVDHGVGFPVEKMARDLPEATAERGRGLPIMRRCADFFTVASAPGEGTTVTLGRSLHHHGRLIALRYGTG